MTIKALCPNHGKRKVLMYRLYRRGAEDEGGKFLKFGWACPVCHITMPEQSVSYKLKSVAQR